MSKYSDKFYEMLHKNSVKRRRMVTLLLVLSTFTASSVVWTLRDTGITMANKDDDDFSSLTASLGNSPTALAQNPGYQSIDNEARGIHISMFDYHVPIYVTKDGDGNDITPYFDYNHEYGEENNFGYSQRRFSYIDKNDDNQKKYYNDVVYPYEHDNVKQYGINDVKRNYGLGDNYQISGDDWNKFLFFLSYGTPLHVGSYHQYNGHGGDRDEAYITIVERQLNNGVGINNYAGDYQSDPKQSGNRPVQGIVENKLSDAGYPVIKGTTHGLDYLFSPITGGDDNRDKIYYARTNYLLHEENGHLRYSSNENYAYLDTSQPIGYTDGDNKLPIYGFDVENETFRLINNDHHIAGDPNAEGGTYSDTVDEDFMIGFFPFDRYDKSKIDPNYNSASARYNHHFGMKMDAEFILPKNTGNDSEPITFSYSGDDDMWVFIDGNLVLDIGGIHEPAAGMIDFTNGLVWVQDNANNPANNEAVSESALPSYISNTLGISTPYEKLPKPAFGYLTQGGENKWVVKKLSDIYSGWSYNGTHKLDMFYLERGGCYSNLSMDINLPTVGTLKVTKDVDFGSHPDDVYDDRTYRFGVYVSEDYGNTYSLLADNIYLKDGESKTFSGLKSDDNYRYKVVEYTDNMNIIGNTVVRGSDILDPSAGGFITSNVAYESVGNKLDYVPSYIFQNKVSETTGLEVTKTWNPQNPPDTINQVGFKLYQTAHYTDGSTSAEKLIVLDNKPTQYITRANDWKWSTNDLPKKFGEITYTYRAVESVVDGYSYSSYTDANGNLVIENKKIVTDAEINVKKNWLNTAPNQNNNIVVELRRMRAPYSGTNANVTIKVVDAGGNPLATRTINNAYVGGGFDFSLNAPSGGDPSTQFTVVSSGGATVNSYGDLNNVFEVLNIQNDTTIVIKYDENIALLKDLVVFGPSTFEGDDNSTYGWSSEGDSSLTPSGADSHSGKNGLLVSNNKASWHGVKYDFAQNGITLEKGGTYTFAFYIKSNGYGTNLKLTMNYPNASDNSIKYTELISQDNFYVNNSEWKLFTCNFTVNDTYDPAYIKIETPNASNDNNISFRIDDAILVKGNHSINVSTDGTVNIDGAPAYTLTSSGTGTSTSWDPVSSVSWDKNNKNDLKGWHSWDSDTLSVDGGTNDNGSEWSCLNVASDGTRNYGMVADSGTKIKNDSGQAVKYRIVANVGKNADDNGDVIHLKLKTFDGNDEITSYNNDANCLEHATTSNWNAFQLSGEVTLQPNQSMEIYIQNSGVSNNGSTTYHPFRVYGVNIEKEVKTSSTVYTLNPTTSPSNVMSSYDIEIDTYSVTKNLAPTNQWELDPNFSKTAELTPSNLTVQWKGEDIVTNGEDNGVRYDYRYYVVEKTINGVDVDYDPTQDGIQPAAGIPSNGVYGDYEIAYLRNEGVDSNTEDSPIEITNTYIWYQLPNTGGMGTTKVYILGVFLIAAGVLGGYTIRKRERRSG